MNKTIVERGPEMCLDWIRDNKYTGGSMYTTDIFLLLDKYYPDLHNKISECLDLANEDKCLIINQFNDKPTFEYIIGNLK